MAMQKQKQKRFLLHEELDQKKEKKKKIAMSIYKERRF
jgi:hypothetical protein